MIETKTGAAAGIDRASPRPGPAEPTMIASTMNAAPGVDLGLASHAAPERPIVAVIAGAADLDGVCSCHGLPRTDR